MKISPQFVVSCDHLQRERIGKHIEVTQGVHMPVEVYVGVFYGLAETGFCLESLDFQWWVARERLVGVVQLDPVGIIAVAVLQRGDGGSADLVDDQGAGRQQRGCAEGRVALLR